MKKFSWFALLSLALVSGCQESTDTTSPGAASVAVAPAGNEKTESEVPGSVPAATGTPAAGATTPAAGADANTVALTEANTKVEFIGVHVGDKPDPRKGGFSKLTGTATLDAGSLKSVTVEFDTDSLTTELPPLTAHLKSPDFFDVKQHPTAKFESTAIEAAADGKVNVTGNLTLLGVTKPITMPAAVSFKDGLKLTAEFSIDRTEFGMTFGEDKVEKIVAMTVTIGS